jgi:hypothetical protein
MTVDKFAEGWSGAAFDGEGLAPRAAERAATIAPETIAVAVRAIIDRVRRLHRDVAARAPLPPDRLRAAAATHTALIEAALQLHAVAAAHDGAPPPDLVAGIDLALASARTLGFAEVYEKNGGV